MMTFSIKQWAVKQWALNRWPLFRRTTVAILWLKMIEAAPLPVFLLSVSWFNSYASGNWAAPYYGSVAVAAVTSFYLLLRGIVLNRIFVGINLYLLSGAIGQWWQLEALNRFYGEVRAAGMLMWIVVAGVITTVALNYRFMDSGFIGIAAADRHSAMRWSLALLAAAIAACAISLVFVGNRWLSELLPFVLLFTLQGRAHGMLHRQQSVAV